MLSILWRTCLCAGFALLLTFSAPAQTYTLTKLFDFSGSINNPMQPYETPTLISNQLWFTTSSGGDNGFGSLASFNLSNNTLTQRFGAFDNSTGTASQSKLTRVGDLLYFTNATGGTGGRGTLNVYNMTTGSNTVLFNAPTTASGIITGLWGAPEYVDRGDGTASIYLQATGGGGPSPGIGGIIRVDINTTTQAVLSTNNIHLYQGGAAHGRQPYESFTRIGDKLYFTTFTGGPATTGAGNGPGTIGVLDLANNDAVNDGLAFLPDTDGSGIFLYQDPTYDPVTNALYVISAGSNTQAPTIFSYDFDTLTVNTVYEMSNDGNFAQGRRAWGELTLVDNKLFYTTILGGANNEGTISMFDLATNTYTKLFDLSASLGTDARGGFAVEMLEVGYNLYLTPWAGGTNDKGTILQLHVVPEPSAPLLTAAGGLGCLALLRNRRRWAGTV